MEQIKIILITNYSDNIHNKLLCTNRYDLLSHIIYTHLLKYSNITLFITKCFAKNNTYDGNINDYYLPESDFIIIIDDRHFINRHVNYIDHYRKNNKYMILTFNDNNFFNVCEDLAIYLDPVCDIDKKNTLYMDYGYDNNLVYQETKDITDKITYIGISHLNNSDNIINEINKFGNNNFVVKSPINLIINNPLDIYFVTDNNVDNILLIELALNNVINSVLLFMIIIFHGMLY